MFDFLGDTDKIGIEIVLILITGLITFLLGRCTSHLDDYRAGMKEIDNSFYKPFLSLYAGTMDSLIQRYHQVSTDEVYPGCLGYTVALASL